MTEDLLAAPGPDFAYPGAPDCFQRLWTPHRMVYVGQPKEPDHACPFCVAPTKDDQETLIIHRGEDCYVICNLYPYSPGHLLVCTYRHVADFTELSHPERDEMALLTQQAMRVIRSVSNPAGFNLGMNQGEVAGAGIASHIHQHIVPRWLGDTNFLPIIAQSRALPQLLAEARQLIAEAWPKES